jgi:hypothetical protein
MGDHEELRQSLSKEGMIWCWLNGGHADDLPWDAKAVFKGRTLPPAAGAH